MRRVYLSVVVLAGGVACSAPAPKDAAAPDPKAPATDPAVVSVPLNLPTLDTTILHPHKSTVIPDDERTRTQTLIALYSLAAATMVNRDGRTLNQLYAPTAVLQGPDSTVTGGPEVVRYLINLAQAKSLADFQRSSRSVRVLDDSTLVDSGAYAMVLKRSARDSVIERGQYASRVRARADRGAWVIIEDRLKPGAPSKKKTGP